MGWARNEGGCQTDPSPIFISMMPSVRHQAPSLPTFIHPFPFSRSSETPLLNSLKAGGRTDGRQPLAVVMAWPVDDAPRVEIERKKGEVGPSFVGGPWIWYEMSNLERAQNPSHPQTQAVVRCFWAGKDEQTKQTGYHRKTTKTTIMMIVSATTRTGSPSPLAPNRATVSERGSGSRRRE